MEEKKYTYEELEKALEMRNNQMSELYMQLQAANDNRLLARLDFLFKVIANKEVFPAGFVSRSVEEIVEILTIPEPEEKAE